jgi:hypothetical protein
MIYIMARCHGDTPPHYWRHYRSALKSGLTRNGTVEEVLHSGTSAPHPTSNSGERFRPRRTLVTNPAPFYGIPESLNAPS